MNVDESEWRDVIMLKGGGGRCALLYEGVYHLSGAASQQEMPMAKEEPEGAHISKSDLFGS